MLKNILLTGVALFLVGVSRLGFNAVALNVFGEKVAGSLNVALSLAVLLSLPASAAFGTSIVRFIGQARGAGEYGRVVWIFRRLFVGTLIIALTSSVCALIFREALAGSRQIAVGLVAQAAVLALAYALYLFMKNTMYAIDRVADYTKLELVSALVFFSALASLAAAGMGGSLLVAFMAGYTVFVFGCFAIGSKYLLRSDPEGAQADGTYTRELTSYSFLAMVGTAVSLGVREFAVVIAPNVGGLAAPAYLALSLSLLAPMGILPRLLRTVLLARSAELDGGSRHERLSLSVSEANHWLLLGTIPLCGAIVLGAGPLFNLVSGESTPERILMLRLLTLAVGLDVIATPGINTLAGTGRIRVPALSAVLGVALAGAVWLAAIPYLGLNGLVLGLLTNSLVRSGIPIWVAYRDLSITLTRSCSTCVALAGIPGGLLLVERAWPHPVLLTGVYAAAAGVILLPSVKEIAAEVLKQLPRSRGSKHAPHI
jgi:O-antigen/teichoic acid export membrane protein